MATADSSSDSLSIKFKVSKEHLRKIEVEPGVLIYHIYPTLADWRGKSVSDAVNPRSHDADAIKGSVPKKIEMTLRDFPQDFYLANRGETLLAESLKFDSENGIVEIFFNDCEGEDAQQGVADGGTTDAVIAAVQDDVADALERKFSQIRSDELPDFLKQSRVHLEVVIGLSERERIARLVEGRNTSKQVKQWTINDFKGGFDWLKKILERPTGPFRGKVGYEENADTAVNVLDVIALLTLFHEAFDKPGKAPTVAYSSKGRLDQKLVDNELGSGYAKLAPLVEDILKLHDHIYVGFNEKYKEVVPTGRLGRYGKTDQRVFLSEPHILPLTGVESTHTIPAGALFPLLAAFRGLIVYDKKNGHASWRTNPFEFFDEHGALLVMSLLEQLQVVGMNPQTLGKTKTAYTALHNQVRLLVFEAN